MSASYHLFRVSKGWTARAIGASSELGGLPIGSLSEVKKRLLESGLFREDTLSEGMIREQISSPDVGPFAVFRVIESDTECHVLGDPVCSVAISRAPPSELSVVAKVLEDCGPFVLFDMEGNSFVNVI